MAAKPRRPMGLALQMPAEQDQSYRVDENGAFVHGALNIGAGGMVVSGGGGSRSSGSSSSNALTVEEAEELKSMSNTRLEDLEFLEKLGEGNSSVVHRAHDRRLNRDFAIKRINIYDKSKRHQIIKELHTLYKCDCPHLISFHGAFFKEGAISIALELMDVGSLSDVLAVVRTIDEPELAYFAKSMLGGLAYLRRKHKIHRDIKPSNICINSAGDAKLSDFGITTSLDNTLSAANSFVGTSAYMSVERLMGSTYKYPSDVWAIGLVLLECATGKFPYALTGLYLDMMQSVINGPSPSVPRAPDGSYGKFSREFAHFIDCCLRKDPDARSTAEELLLHPWFAKMEGTRTPAQMAAWVAAVKPRVQERARIERAKANGEPLAALSTTSGAAGTTAAAAGAGGSADPFEVGYNQTTTGGGSAGAQQAPRFNVPADSTSSFYIAKEINDGK